MDSAELQYQGAQALVPSVAAAVHSLLACITGGGKVLACGSGSSASAAHLFAALCVNGFERPRPELAALALDGTHDLARQVRALGQDVDVLLLLAPDGNDTQALAALDAAHARDMVAVLLTGADGGALATKARDGDVLLAVPHARPARVREMHNLLLHCLCDGIDALLLGVEEIA